MQKSFCWHTELLSSLLLAVSLTPSYDEHTE